MNGCARPDAPRDLLPRHENEPETPGFPAPENGNAPHADAQAHTPCERAFRWDENE